MVYEVGLFENLSDVGTFKISRKLCFHKSDLYKFINWNFFPGSVVGTYDGIRTPEERFQTNDEVSFEVVDAASSLNPSHILGLLLLLLPILVRIHWEKMSKQWYLNGVFEVLQNSVSMFRKWVWSLTNVLTSMKNVSPWTI